VESAARLMAGVAARAAAMNAQQAILVNLVFMFCFWLWFA
jgi:hypothetical protein